MTIPIAALIPLVLMCCLIAGGVIAFAKIATTPEPSLPSAYYMYSSNYETGADRDRNTSLVSTPERVYVPPGDVERGMGPGAGVPAAKEMAYAHAGQPERRMGVQREGSYGQGAYPDMRTYNDQRGYEQRGYNSGGGPYPAERAVSPLKLQKQTLYSGERAVSPEVGGQKERVYDGGEQRGVVQTNASS